MTEAAATYEGYTHVATETFRCGSIANDVEIYTNERFAAAIGLAPDERDARIEFVAISGGAFRRGIAVEDLKLARDLNEELEGGLEVCTPASDVEVGDILIARTVLTQQVWDGLAESLGIELWDQRYTESPYLPVHGITYAFFQDVAEPLGLRLPTEAEWEYAARGGSPLSYPWGDTQHGAFEHAWYGHPHEGGPMGVAQKKPNGFGLYDVAGNVWEMCADHWHENYAGAPEGPGPWVDDDDPLQRVMRGGSFRSQTVAHLMCAFRSSAGVYYSGDDLGIRPVARQALPSDAGADD